MNAINSQNLSISRIEDNREHHEKEKFKYIEKIEILKDTIKSKYEIMSKLKSKIDYDKNSCFNVKKTIIIRHIQSISVTRVSYLWEFRPAALFSVAIAELDPPTTS